MNIKKCTAFRASVKVHMFMYFRVLVLYCYVLVQIFTQFTLQATYTVLSVKCCGHKILKWTWSWSVEVVAIIPSVVVLNIRNYTLQILTDTVP